MKACSNAWRYKGIREPRCNGGDPCLACRKIYRQEKKARLNPPPSFRDDPAAYRSWYATIYGGP